MEILELRKEFFNFLFFRSFSSICTFNSSITKVDLSLRFSSWIFVPPQLNYLHLLPFHHSRHCFRIFHYFFYEFLVVECFKILITDSIEQMDGLFNNFNHFEVIFHTLLPLVNLCYLRLVLCCCFTQNCWEFLQERQTE